MTRKYIIEELKDLKINGKPLIFIGPHTIQHGILPILQKDFHRITSNSSKTFYPELNFEHTKLNGARYITGIRRRQNR